jgi:hypothetical protein
MIKDIIYYRKEQDGELSRSPQVAQHGLKGCQSCECCRFGAGESSPGHFPSMNEIARISRQPCLVSRCLDYDSKPFSFGDVFCQMLLIQSLRLLHVGTALQRPEQQRL